MASAFAHALASVAIGKLTFIKQPGLKFWLLGAFCAVVPDADVISFAFGIPYESLWGHRGITHSLFFSVLLGLAVTLLAYRNVPKGSKHWWLLVVFFTLATASHAVLDALTTGGKGVAFFAPFNNQRYFFPFRPIQVSPIGVAKFFSEWGWRVIKSEILWVGVPSAMLIGLAYVINRFRPPTAK